jgi:diguanylate cyclase (GGDEF)-like protein
MPQPGHGRGSTEDPPGRTRLWLAASLLVLCGGLVASIVGSLAWNGSEARRAHGHFEVAAGATGDALRSTLLRYGDLVQSVGALLQPGSVTTAQFNHYLTSAGYFGGQYPGVLGVGGIDYVTQPQLSAFVSSVRADGLSNYTVLPTGTRTRYCLGRYAATMGLKSPLPLLGYDFCTVPVMSQALEQAALTGQHVVIPGARIGAPYVGDFVLVVPLYEKTDPGPRAGRPMAIRGWSLAFVASAEVEHAALDGDASGTTFSLFAGSSPDPADRVMATSPSSVQPRNGWASTQRFSAYGAWTLQMSPLPGAFTPSSTGPVVLLVVGVLASLLLAMLIWLLAFSRSRALAMVRERTIELEELALHDVLTGLPNRALIMDRATQMLTRARRQNSTMSALFLDLDNFKDVNDSFGHDTGDELLEAVAKRLSSAVRGAETIGRLGGDEFVVLVDDGTEASAELVAERLHAVLSKPFHLPGQVARDVEIQVSIGVAVGLRDTAEELLRDADLALYEAKALGKNQSVVFRSEMQQAARERRVLEADLRGALDRGELSLQYQPTFDLTNGVVNGVEALLRWNHPERGPIPPDTFISTAEDTGLIGPIGRFVLEQACDQAGRWHAMGHPITVAINVSGRQLDRDDFVHDVRSALALSGLPAGFLTLEMTESVLMRDVDATVDRLLILKDLGVRLAIDDFGTGYSSLAYLQRFPVDTLKIDRSFVAHMSESSESAALIHTLVQLGKTLHLETLAEGIEEDYQLAMLRSEGCDSGQGFLFARPLDPSDAEEFLLNQPIRGSISPPVRNARERAA